MALNPLPIRRCPNCGERGIAHHQELCQECRERARLGDQLDKLNKSNRDHLEALRATGRDYTYTATGLARMRNV
jgi:hypothetical protein